MAPLKKSERYFPPCNGLSVRAKSFVFFDKNSGTRRFEIKADHNGRMPVEEAVSFLAVHCLARHQLPGDFEVLVGIRGDLIRDLVSRAMTLMHSCSSPPLPALPAQLTQRQTQVLMGITQTLTNKEIASKLNVSERTVKFHVSALLEKFHVRRRVDLLLGAEGFLFGSAHKAARLNEDFADEHPSTPALLGFSAPSPLSSAAKGAGM